MGLFDSKIWRNCYENETNEGEGTGAEGAGAEGNAGASGAEGANGAGASGVEGAGGDNKVFRTQQEVNQYLAADRRKTEQKFKAQMKMELQKQEAMYNKLLTNTSLTEQERDALRESLTEVESKLHSETDRLRKEKKDLEDTHKAKVIELEKMKNDWETRYRDSTIQRELQEAAVKYEAHNTKQMIALLKPYTKLVEVDGKFEVMVDLEDLVDGKPQTSTLSPDAALKRMKELPDLYGNLFRANVVSGTGGGGSGGQKKNLNPKNMTQAEYAEWRKTALA